MRINNFSLSERKEMVLKLKEELEKEGFNASWSGEAVIQIEDLPIPKIVPFDIAKLTIRIDEYHIYFAIIINFIKVLEDLIDAEEINNVCELHNEWFDKLASYLSPIDPTGKLQWDIEYDVDIEDSLSVNFDTVEEVIPFIHNLRKFIDYEAKKG